MFLLGLLAFVLVFSGVYALFATTLNITGTAGGATEFKIEFSDYEISNENKGEVSLDSANTMMNITVDLDYPGDSVVIDFTIKNAGRLNSVVENINIDTNNTDDFTVNILGLSDIKGTTLSPNQTTEGAVVVTWNSASTNQEPENVSFSVSIDYLQATS